MLLLPAANRRRVGSLHRSLYTFVQRMPIEADGCLRYRIKSKSGQANEADRLIKVWSEPTVEVANRDIAPATPRTNLLYLQARHYDGNEREFTALGGGIEF